LTIELHSTKFLRRVFITGIEKENSIAVKEECQLEMFEERHSVSFVKLTRVNGKE
jgi:hypothetical protein